MVNRAKIIAAVDVGSSKITTLIAQISSASEKINVVGAASVPSLGIRKGQIVNIEEASQGIIQSVESAERMAGYSVSHTLISVGGAHISSQNSHGVVAVSEPEGEIDEEDVRRVIEAARAISLPSSRELLHVIPRNYTVDSQEGIADPIGMSGVRLEVETHIITGSSTSIRNLTKCVSEVGAKIDSLVFSGIASAEAVISETERELGVVLVDIGGGTTSIVIFLEGAPVYTSVLPIGAKNVTNDLAIGLRLSLETAEKLKIALGEKENKLEETKAKEMTDEIATDKKEEKKEDEIDLGKFGIDEVKSVSRKTVVEGIVKPRLNEIFTMVGLEIQKSSFAGMTPSGIVLCGGGALTVGAVEACKRSLALPVRIGFPAGVSGLIDDIISPAFSSSVGLILIANKEGLSSAKFPLPKVGQFINRIPIKNLMRKIVDLIRSFLP